MLRSKILEAGSFLLAIGFLTISWSGEAFAAKDEFTAKFINVEGEVFVDRGVSMVAYKGMSLKDGDTVKTGAGSYADIAYDADMMNILRIRENSEVAVGQASLKEETGIFLKKGEVFLKLEALPAESEFKVRTPVAVAGARGTGLGVSYDAKEAIIKSFEDEIFVKGITKEEKDMLEEVLLKEGWKVFVKEFEEPSRMEKLTGEEIERWNAWKKEIESILSGRAAGSSGSGTGGSGEDEELLDKGQDMQEKMSENVEKKLEQFNAEKEQVILDNLKDNSDSEGHIIGS
jgi:hypothetical protein